MGQTHYIIEDGQHYEGAPSLRLFHSLDKAKEVARNERDNYEHGRFWTLSESKDPELEEAWEADDGYTYKQIRKIESED